MFMYTYFDATIFFQEEFLPNLEIRIFSFMQVFIVSMKYTWAPQTVHNTPVMNILKGYYYIILF